MKKGLIYIFTAAALVLTASCSQFGGEPAPISGEPETAGREVRVWLPLSVVSLECPGGEGTPLSRASLEEEDEQKISDVWVFQFGEAATDDERQLVCPPYYIDPEAILDAELDWIDNGRPTLYAHIPIPLIESQAGEVHLVAFAANINSKDFNWGMSSVEGQRSTYGELKKQVFLLNSEADSYGGDLNKNLIMSGRVYSAITPEIVLDDIPDNPDADDDNDEEGIPLYRSLSRIELELSIAPDVNYKVLSVQLRNIPQRIDIFDALIARDENLFVDHSLTYPELPANLIDYELITAPDRAAGLLSMGDPARRWVWYIPRNMRGQTQSHTPRTKNTFAPQGATYIEVTAVNLDDNDSGVIYRIYPGLDDVNDHTVLGNHRYNVELNIDGDDALLYNDSRVEQYEHVRFDGNNNSFILNPPMEGMGRRYFEIPVTQVNRYWRQMWDGYGQLGENILKSGTDWQVDLLWQDNAGMVRDLLDMSKTDSHIWLEKTTGSGGDEVFAVSVPHNATHGNFVMALRARENGVVVDNVLWSWHLWVTDYCPDEERNHIPDGRKFVYPVTGGQVERLGGPVWGYDTAGATATNNWNNYEYNPASTAACARAFMMDRALGSLSTTYSSATPIYLFYQFGRKDPLPAAATNRLFKVDGTAITSAATPGFSAQRWTDRANSVASDVASTMQGSVEQPMRMVNVSPWATDVNGHSPAPTTPEYKAYMWNDPQVQIYNYADTNYPGKSIYDPCPPGWRVPASNTWQDFRHSATSGYTLNNNASHGRGDGFGYFDYGTRYWPNIGNDEGEHPVEGVIRYPAMGYRRYTTSTTYYGRYYYMGDYTRIWMANPTTEANAYCMYLNTSSVTSSNSYGRSYALSVRCVTIEDN